MTHRGMLCRILSDNSKTFKPESKSLTAILENADVKRHFTDLHVTWSFNLVKASWWGGIFE